MRRLGLVAAGILLSAAVMLAVPESNVDASKSSRRDVAALARYTEVIRLERNSLLKTQGLLDDKLTLRQAEMKRRLRAIYKLSRANWPRLWFEPEARRESARWLGAARRVAMRDVREIDMLHVEIELAERADLRLKRESQLAPAASPKRHSLQWPLEESEIVQSYGEYRGPSHRVKLRSRGVRLASVKGQSVVPVSSGRVRYRGPIRGLGISLIIDHGGLTSIIGNLGAVNVDVGTTVTRETVIAEATGESVYLELRLSVGQRGQAIDPAGLLVAPH